MWHRRSRASLATRNLFRRSSRMNILLYNPDNEVTNNFMPHLWMFLLKSLTPPGHEVLLVDGNAQRMSAPELVEYACGHAIGLAGIGFMTRMAGKAYRMADALRAAGMPVVMGGPHVTEVPGEPLGRDGEARHADAVALGEADQIWPRIVADAANGTLREVYAPVDDNGKEIKPSLSNYPEIPWDQMDLSQFNLLNRVPRLAVRCLGRGMKVGKEEIVGMWKAVEVYLSQDSKALTDEWWKRLEYISKQLRDVQGVSTAFYIPEIANHVPHMRIEWDPRKFSLTTDAAFNFLKSGKPSVLLQKQDDGVSLAMNSFMLRPGQERIIAARLKQMFQLHRA